MDILLSDSFIAYQKKKNFTAITVTACSSGGSCCRILAPKIRTGEPSSSLDQYQVFEVQGIRFYITNKLTLENTVSFSFDTLLGRSRFDMTGFQVQRFCDR